MPDLTADQADIRASHIRAAAAIAILPMRKVLIPIGQDLSITLGEPCSNFAGLHATKGTHVLEGKIKPWNDIRIVEAAHALVRCRRTATDVEGACLQGGGVGEFEILVDDDPGCFRIAREHAAVSARYEDVLDLAQCTARCLRNAHVCHVATTGRSEQVVSGIEPERVDIGVFVIVREFTRSPHAAIAHQTRTNQIDLIARNDTRERRTAFQHAGDHGPRAAVSAAVLLVETSVVDHIPGGDVDLLEARIALESFVEEVGVRHIQATTVEIEQARETSKPVAEVAHLDAIGTIAHATIFASFTEVGLDVLDLDDGHGQCPRCRKPGQLCAVFGNQMVCRGRVIIEAH